ncbi:MAG: Nif3-like dinuclear metal center hexameric protein [Streptococcaceae bacterium]|jgi:dinuclear metal center YbgI/SA1388 family protein|nr:Nif3-like dinuclear metal center hexameric protein [Streptococcaceae bacterium]
MNIGQFVEKYEAFCPKELAEAGDPVGLQIGSLNTKINKVLVTLDIREQTVAEAIDKKVDLIFAKHPIIFKPLENLTDSNSQEKLVLDLAKAGIAVYTSHTNIDIVDGGMNDWFCQAFELTEVEPLNESGIGRIGNIPALQLKEFVARARQVFGQERLRIVSYDHSLSQKIRRVAICGGSGGKFWPDALEKGADLYITADIYYHVGHDICSSKLTVLDPGHYMEHIFTVKAAEKLRELAPHLQILESQENTNPFYDI